MSVRPYLLLAAPLFALLTACGSSSDSSDTNTTQPGSGGSGGAGGGGGAGVGGIGVGGSKSCSSTVVRCVNGKEEEFYCDPCAGPNQIDCNIPDGHVSCGNGACVPGGQTCGGGQGGGGQGGAGAGGAGQGGAGAGGAGQGGAGAGGGTGGTTGTSIEGSFDLLFADVKAESSLTGGPPVSLGTKARIDIRKSADDTAYEALFTSSFSSPQGMTVSVTADKVTLSG